MSPTVSILLPVYNGAATLRRAVDSMLDQTYPHFELLLVNNASTDATSSIIHEYATLDTRVRPLYESQKGIAFALNHGVREAKGPYIARMDADDVSYPTRLEKQVAFMEQHPEIGLVAGLINHEGSSTDTEGYAEYVRQLNRWNTEAQLRHYRFVESPFAHPSVLFRKELMDAYGYYTEAEEPEDYELWLRWFQHGVRMHKLAEPVLGWYDSPTRLTRTDPRCSAECLDAVRYRYLAQWLKSRKDTLPPLYVWGGGKLANRKMKRLQEYSGIPIAGIIDIKEKTGAPLPHIHYLNLPEPGRIFVVSMVSNRGKYQEIDDFLQQRGYVAERDYVLAQ